MVAHLIVGEHVSWKLMPFVCSKPQATNLAFNFSTCPFVISSVLKTHLLVIFLLQASRSYSFQVWFFIIESYSCCMVAFHLGLIITFSCDWIICDFKGVDVIFWIEGCTLNLPKWCLKWWQMWRIGLGSLRTSLVVAIPPTITTSSTILGLKMVHLLETLMIEKPFFQLKILSTFFF
jgi:hypothetical protein